MTYVQLFSLAVMAQGYPQLLGGALCRAVHKRGLSLGAKGKVLGFCGHTWCQPLEMLGFDSMKALQLQLPPGQTEPVPPHHLESTLVPCMSTCLHLIFTT